MAVSNRQVQSSEDFEKNSVQEVSSQFGKVNSISRSEDVNNQQNIKSNSFSIDDSHKISAGSMNLQEIKSQNSDRVYSYSKVDPAIANTENQDSKPASQSASINNGQKHMTNSQAIIPSVNEETLNPKSINNSRLNRGQVSNNTEISKVMGNTRMQTSSLRSNITVHSKKGKANNQYSKGKILPQTGDQKGNWILLGIVFVILAILLITAI